MSLLHRIFGGPDGHLADRIYRIQLVVWIALAIYLFLTGSLFWPLPIVIAVVGTILQLLSGRVARNMYDPTGSGVKSKPAYSGPESLAVRGRFEEAIAAYKAAAAEEPDDPEPWLRIARIERSDLKRPQRALDALRAARERADATSPTALLISRELADVYLSDLGEPTRAMPELARLAATHPDTPHGRWAARELAELKKTVDRRQ